MFHSDIVSTLSLGLKELFGIQNSAHQLTIEETKKDFSGHFTFVLFPYLSQMKMKPEEAGNALGLYVKKKLPIIKNFNVIKGFVNFEITDREWFHILKSIQESEDFGKSIKKNKKIVIEFSSPNTNKPLHLGHLRNNFLGDSLARIFIENGYEVSRVNLVNDRGIHICKSMYAYQQFGQEKKPQSEGIKGDHWVGKFYVKFNEMYQQEVDLLIKQGVPKQEAERRAPSLLGAQRLLKEWEKGNETVLQLWKEMNQWVYDGFESTYARMGVFFDKIYYESQTYLSGKKIIEEGLKQKVFYEKEDGSVWIDLSEDKLDEKLLLRADGTSVYMTQDLGTCDLRYQDFAFDKSIYVVGNEQNYHFKVLRCIMKKMGRKYAENLYHLSYGMVDLPSGKMKSREGTVVDADDLMDEMEKTAKKQTLALGKIEGLSEIEAENLFKKIGMGALKYFLLKVDPHKKILFDPEQSIAFHGDTGPFIQYTYARIAAIMRRAKVLGWVLPISQTAYNEDLDDLERNIIIKMYQFPNVLEKASSQMAPSILAQYLFDLAKTYNTFYQALSIFNEKSEEKIKLRWVLSSQTGEIIKKGMNCLGIEVPERM